MHRSFAWLLLSGDMAAISRPLGIGVLPRGPVQAKVNKGQRPADLAMIEVPLVDHARALPPPGRGPMHRNPPSKDAQQIEGPLGVLPLALVGADRRVSKSDRQPANFSHHVKWREEIKKDGQNVRFSGQRGRSRLARYLHVLRVVTVKYCNELLVTVADVSVDKG